MGLRHAEAVTAPHPSENGIPYAYRREDPQYCRRRCLCRRSVRLRGRGRAGRGRLDRRGEPVSRRLGHSRSGGAGAQAIEPITFNDEAIGLTETCDQIVPDFDAAQYKASSSAQDETVYLLHCTLDFSGNLSFDSETNHALNLVDDNDKHHHSYSSSSGVDDDMKQAGLDPISYDDYGTNHVDGWYAFTVWGKDGKADPLPEGATTLSYERSSLTGKDGKTYEAYSTRAKVTVKNG